MTAPGNPPTDNTPNPALDEAELPALNEQATAWRILTHALGVDLRHRLIPLITTGVFPFDTACDVLTASGLPPLPRPWHADLDLTVTQRLTATDPGAAGAAFLDNLDNATRQAFGSDTTADADEPTTVAAAGHQAAGTTARFDVTARATIHTRVRAETDDTAGAQAAAAGEHLVAVLAEVGILLEHHVDRRVHPDLDSKIELDARTDARHSGAGATAVTFAGVDITAVRAERDREIARYRRQTTLIRTALLFALDQGGIDSRPGARSPFAMVDDLLRRLGQHGLPRAHLYEVTAAIALLIPASSAAEARIAAYRLRRDASATTPQCGMPVTIAENFREPDITAAGADGYRVTWYETYLVCLRGTPARQLAEAVVRIQLGVLAADVPGIRNAPLRTTYLGEHLDHCLDPDRD